MEIFHITYRSSLCHLHVRPWLARSSPPAGSTRSFGAGLALDPAPRYLIRDYLLQRVEHDTVRNRADVVAALQEAGLEVPRQGKNYLTALDRPGPGGG